TIFGVVMAISLVRYRWRGRGLANSLIDLPFAISPVVVGLALILVYGRKGWFGQWLIDHGVQVIFSFPAMVLATIFVSLPFVVDAGSLEGPAGSLPALLGPSGRGKSTLLRLIAGLDMPDTGRVLIAGEDRTTQPARKRDVGFVFQHYAAFKHMSVRDNVAFALSIRKVPKERIRARVDELLRLVHLEAYGDRYPSQLSGGQRQRMALARALAV